MAEVRKSVEELFAGDEFGVFLSDWQRTTMVLDESLAPLRDQMIKDHAKDYVVRTYGHHSNATWPGGAPTSYAPRQASRGLSDNAMALRHKREEAKTAERFAKKALLDFSRAQGISQFADYGLWQHTKDAEIISATDLRAKTEDAENHFLEVDQLVRDNPGEILTIVGLSAAAGRLAVGGIDIVNRDYVAFPVKGYGTCFETGLSSRSNRVHQSSELRTRALDIHNYWGKKKSQVLGEWSNVLNIGEWYVGSPGATFILGEPVEGEPVIPDDRDREGLLTVLNRIRTVGENVVRVTALQKAK